jgi:L-iditol 2-dehydrogenase
VHIHSVYHCGNVWGRILNILRRHADRFPLQELISHRLGLAEIVENMEIVQDPNQCMKVEVVPHRAPVA